MLVKFFAFIKNMSWNKVCLIFSLTLLLAAAAFYSTLYFFPAQDGGGHILNAYALLGALKDTQPFARTFWVTYDPVFLMSNCLGTVIIMIGGLWNQYEPAYRCLILITLLITTGGFAWLYWSINKEWGDGFVAGLIVIVFMQELFLGFFNWTMGLGFGFASIAYWAQNRHRNGWAPPLILTIMWLFTFWIHALASNVLMAGYFIIAVFGLLYDRASLKPPLLAARWLLPLIPTVIISVYFTSLIPSDGVSRWEFINYYVNLLNVELIRPFNNVGLLSGQLMAIIFLVGILEAMLDRFAAHRTPTIHDGILAASFFAVLAYMLLPFARYLGPQGTDGLVNGSRIGGYINSRMLGPAVLLLCIWYGSRKTIWSRALMIGIMILGIFHGHAIAQGCLKDQNAFRQISAAGPHIPPNSVVAYESNAPEMSARQGNYYSRPFLHVVALAVVRSEDSIFIGRHDARGNYIFPHPFLKRATKPPISALLIWKGTDHSWPGFKEIYRSDQVTIMGQDVSRA